LNTVTRDVVRPGNDDIEDMGDALRQSDQARNRRALDRIAEHCELSARRAAAIDDRRTQVRARLEHELGPELTRALLTGLASSAA
jgi:hypothetical protein